MRFIDALTQYPAIPYFGLIGGTYADDFRESELDPIDSPVLRESEIYDTFIVKAKHVLSDGTISDCYVDLFLPERISESAFFRRRGEIEFRYQHKCDGEIICAVPMECFGDYELFYSRTAPDVGINILKKGLAASIDKQHIAHDLGYILRDECRFAEAAEMFQLAVDRGPSSYFLYGELGDCYEKLGETEKAQRYHAMFNAQHKLP